MEYNYSSDRTEERGFISKEKILNYVSEEDIYEMVFGFKPAEYDYVKSPFRQDGNPGCWFEYVKGKLIFTDLGNKGRYGRIKLDYTDCFDVVQVHFRIPNFYQALKFIKKHLIDGKDLPKREVQKFSNKDIKKEAVQILVRARKFNLKDKDFWDKYGISSQNLIDDRVFPTSFVRLLNTKKGDVTFATNDITYAFTDFDFQRKKIYRPNLEGKNRFITNCKADDIGNIKQLKPYGTQLVISKSYKDCRVLRNQGLNAVWFQNEGMRPSIKATIDLCKRFEDIIIFYDNDESGIKASDKISNEINIMLPNKSRALYLPPSLCVRGITDPADLVAKDGQSPLRQFLTENKIIYE